MAGPDGQVFVDPNLVTPKPSRLKGAKPDTTKVWNMIPMLTNQTNTLSEYQQLHAALRISHGNKSYFTAIYEGQMQQIRFDDGTYIKIIGSDFMGGQYATGTGARISIQGNFRGAQNLQGFLHGMESMTTGYDTGYTEVMLLGMMDVSKAETMRGAFQLIDGSGNIIAQAVAGPGQYIPFKDYKIFVNATYGCGQNPDEALLSIADMFIEFGTGKGAKREPFILEAERLPTKNLGNVSIRLLGLTPPMVENQFSAIIRAVDSAGNVLSINTIATGEQKSIVVDNVTYKVKIDGAYPSFNGAFNFSQVSILNGSNGDTMKGILNAGESFDMGSVRIQYMGVTPSK